MTHEELKEILDYKDIPYEMERNNLVITYKEAINLDFLDSLPSDLIFRTGYVYLDKVKRIPAGVKFENHGDINLESLIGWLYDWEGNIRGIRSKTLLNKMISLGIFNR